MESARLNKTRSIDKHNIIPALVKKKRMLFAVNQRLTNKTVVKMFDEVIN